MWTWVRRSRPWARWARWSAWRSRSSACTNLTHVRFRCLQCDFVVYQCACSSVLTLETSVLCRRCAGAWLPVGVALVAQTAHRDASQLARLHQRILDRAARLPGSPERRRAGEVG